MKGIEIIYEDETIVVVSKPPNFLTIPDRYGKHLPNMYKYLQQSREAVFVVHRIDKETSGVLVFAKTEQAHQHLSMQFQNREVKKIYKLIVDGTPNPPEGTIDQPIRDHQTRPGMMKVHKSGKPSVTHYKVVESFRFFSIIDAQIDTGRTHQIRVHFKFLGHTLSVDKKYGRREALPLSEIKKRYRETGRGEKPLLTRTSLHSHSLTLKHPETMEEMSFEAPLPKDMRAVVNQLRKWG